MSIYDHFGFVYIWYDRKRKMFYIGSHMGNVDDGYICSSNRMRNVYRRRPEDFKRRILYYLRVNDRNVLLKEELRWLLMIKENEIRIKYYNLRVNATGPMPDDIREHWQQPEKRERHIASMTKAWTPERRKAHGDKIKAKWQDPEYQAKMSKRKGHTPTPEENKRTAERNRNRVYTPELRKRMSDSAKKRANTPEYIARFTEAIRNCHQNKN